MLWRQFSLETIYRGLRSILGSEKSGMTHIELKKIRLDLGLTQAELAFKLFRTKDCITKWESGKYPIPKQIYLLLTGLINGK